jgi:hypothetical protein
VIGITVAIRTPNARRDAGTLGRFRHTEASIHDHLSQCAATLAFENATLCLFREVIYLLDEMRVSTTERTRDWSDVGRGWRGDWRRLSWLLHDDASL